MAKIIKYDFNKSEDIVEVTYETGSVRKYSLDKLPKTVQLFVGFVPLLTEKATNELEKVFDELEITYSKYESNTSNACVILVHLGKNSGLDDIDFVGDIFDAFNDNSLDLFIRLCHIVHSYSEEEIISSLVKAISSENPDTSETIPAEEPEQPEDFETVPETETAETTPEQPMAKAFGVRRLEKIIFNCIILHMENSAEIIRALKSDIKKYGIEEVFHYQKISVSNDFVIEKIRVFVPFDDETDLIHLELEVRNLFLKNSRMVFISDKLSDKMLDFGFYDINFTLTGTHKTLPCDYIIEKERPDYTPETIPAEEPEQPEDVEPVSETTSVDKPETTTATEKQDFERCSDCVHYSECDKKYTPDSVGCLQYMKRRYHPRE